MENASVPRDCALRTFIKWWGYASRRYRQLIADLQHAFVKVNLRLALSPSNCALVRFTTSPGMSATIRGMSWTLSRLSACSWPSLPVS